MATGIEIGGAIKSLSAAVSLAKTVMEVAMKIDNTELIRAIADLNLGIADLTNQLAELKQENVQLKGKIRELEESFKPERQLKIGDDEFYYDGTGSGPLCTRCFGKDGKTIGFQRATSNSMIFGKFTCPSCNEFFK